jgi:hypothetical protein
MKSTRGASELFLDTPSRSGSEPRRCLRAEIALLIAQMRQDILLPVKDSYWDSEVADRRSRARLYALNKKLAPKLCAGKSQRNPQGNSRQAAARPQACRST